ncbi:MAG: hypothetical protein R3F46_03405 [bacterium]
MLLTRVLGLFMLMLLASSCQAVERFGVKSSRTSLIVKSMSHSPEVIHTGDNVLIEIELGKDTYYTPGGSGAEAGPGPFIFSQQVQLLPLAQGSYAPGDSIPDPGTAQQTDIATLTSEAANKGLRLYVLFRAPETPQQVQVRYFTGSRGNNTRMDLSVEVQ